MGSAQYSQPPRLMRTASIGDVQGEKQTGSMDEWWGGTAPSCTICEKGNVRECVQKAKAWSVALLAR